MKVLHINTEKEFRGGERQLIFLIESLEHAEHYLVTNKNGHLKDQLPDSSFHWNGKSPYQLLGLIRLNRWIVKNQIRIIHAHSSKGHTIGFLLKIINRRLRLIATKRTAFTSNNFFSTWKFKSTDQIVSVSKAVQKNIKHDSVVIYDGIKVYKGDHEDLRDELKLNSQSIVIGTIAALTKEKNIEGFLRVAKSMALSHTNTFFVWIGDGNLREKVVAMRTELGLDKKVFFVGFKEYPQRYIKKMDIFFFPSKNEGLGSSVLDAFTIGTPVVSSNSGGLNELIVNNENGLKSEVKNESEMISNIEKLLSDNELRNTLSKNALSFSKSFSIERMSNQYLSLYQHLLTND